MIVCYVNLLSSIYQAFIEVQIQTEWISQYLSKCQDIYLTKKVYTIFNYVITFNRYLKLCFIRTLGFN